MSQNTPPDITNILDQATDAIRQHKQRAANLKKELKEVHTQLHNACKHLSLITTNLANDLRGIPQDEEGDTSV